ncbi:membrane dipeptidase [Prosthecobacter sp. SYSU 5D2]|uniref:dipeptidase n=1 Tax=Prosthecobacter sp. SYSU 5D2 TaxID=3134134 RepID=UPI0031FEFFA5
MFPRGAAAFDVEAFFASNFIVDGLGTYYDTHRGKGHPYPSPEGPWDFKPLKQETGCNMVIMSYSTQASFDNQSERFKEGLYKNARIIRTFADIREIREKGEFGVLMYVQSPYPMGGGIQNLEKFHERGLRVFQLAYGASHTEQAPEDVMGYGNDQEGGVTPLGEKVIAELNRLGMLVDISHCNEQTTLDACRLSKFPVVCTHAGARAVTDRDRNKSDTALKAIAATGGVVGVTAVGWIIENHKTKGRGVPEFCDHLDHMKKVIGVDHLSVATDSPLRGWDRLSPHRTSPELSDIGHWKTVAAELHRRGYTEEELKKIFGLNLVTLFRKVLKP